MNFLSFVLMDKSKLEFQAMNLPSWMKISMEFAKDESGMVYERKKESETVYVNVKNGYSCLDCGVGIEAVTIYHSVHDTDDLIPLSGHGDVKEEEIPYCPNCEEKPEYIAGNFITPRDNDLLLPKH